MAKQKKTTREELVGPDVKPELQDKEIEKLNSIMGLTVNTAYAEALKNGASVAGISNPVNRIANVDAIPEIKPLKK